MKVMSIFGTRPEIIRLSRIFPLLDKHFKHIMVNTNQNYTKELNSAFFSELELRVPNYNLKISTGNFGTEVAEIISKSDKIILKDLPNVLEPFLKSTTQSKILPFNTLTYFAC